VRSQPYSISDIFNFPECPLCHRAPRVCDCLKQAFEPHSGATEMKQRVEVTTTDVAQFLDEVAAPVYEMPSEYDDVRGATDTKDTDLSEFFARPVKLTNFTWSTTLAMFKTFNPWGEFFKDKRVINRISNFKLLKGKLCVKFVINGNAFYYGRGIVSYLPFHDLDAMSTNASGISEDIVQASQQPHLYLDPTRSMGGTLCLPFFYDRDAMDIPDTDWLRMGEITVRHINMLRHAGGSLEPVQIVVYAWMEDVVLSGMTTVNPLTIIPQSGDETEEVNKKGFISGPASAVANVAGKLTTIPVIGKYMRATEMVMKTTAGVAKIFGYSRPAITAEAMSFKPKPVSGLATTTTGDNCAKLTFDDKQELSIDQDISGITGPDPLAITSISTRESYWNSFDWTNAQPISTLLANFRVTPIVWREQGSPTAYHLPACCAAALPFEYWTGTMKYRFQVVCSGFHRGRLKITYDPTFNTDTEEYNTAFSKIIDIGETQDFTLTVGPSQRTLFMGHQHPGQDSVTEVWSTTPYASQTVGPYSELRDNGVISISVVTELTNSNPSFGGTVEVNVFVSTGDDFEVAVPSNNFQYFVFKPQSGDEQNLVTDNTKNPSMPEQEYVEHFNTSYTPDSKNLVYFGETVKSFRSVLKRYSLWTTIGNGTAFGYLFRKLPYFPYYRGAVPNAVNTTTAAAPYNYCNTLMLHWVAGMFSGFRGSIRYKVLPTYVSDEKVRTLSVTRYGVEETTEYAVNDGVQFTGAVTNEKLAKTCIAISSGQLRPTGAAGSAVTLTNVNGSLEFEMPWYSPRRFAAGKHVNWTAGNSFGAGGYYLHGFTAPEVVYDIYAAAGEDFQAYFFTGMPRLYYEAVPPA